MRGWVRTHWYRADAYTNSFCSERNAVGEALDGWVGRSLSQESREF